MKNQIIGKCDACNRELRDTDKYRFIGQNKKIMICLSCHMELSQKIVNALRYGRYEKKQ